MNNPDFVNLGLYAFSALIQADAAIFALFAIFVIYKLQAIDSQIRTAIDICESSPGNPKEAVRRLLQVTTDSDRHGIYWQHRSSLYAPQMRLIAFLPSWKETLPRRGIPLILSVIAHISLSSFFLYQAMNEGNVFLLSPEIRVALGLILFVATVIYISFVGYRMLISDESKIVPPIPVLPLDDLKASPEEVLLPKVHGVQRMYKYSWKGVDFHVYTRHESESVFRFSISPVDPDHFENVQVQDGEFSPRTAKDLWRRMKENRDTMFSVKERT